MVHAQLSALIDGLAIQLLPEDPRVSSQRMLKTAVRAAARELGIEPTEADPSG